MTNVSPITRFYTHVAAANGAKAAEVLHGASLTTHGLDRLVPFGDALSHNDFDALPGLYFLDRIETIRRDRRSKDVPPDSLDAVQHDLANLVMEAVPSALPHVARLILLSDRKMSPLFSSSDQILRQLRRMLSRITISDPEDLAVPQFCRPSPTLIACYDSYHAVQPSQEDVGQKETMTLKVRVTEEEHERITREAADMGLTTTNLLRDRLDLPPAPNKSRRKSLLRDSNYLSDEERRALKFWYDDGSYSNTAIMGVSEYLKKRTLRATSNELHLLVSRIRENIYKPLPAPLISFGTYEDSFSLDG